MIRAAALFLAVALACCALLTPPAGQAPTPLEQAASDLTLAWIAYDRAEGPEARLAARDAMVAALSRATGLVPDLGSAAPSPGIVALVGELLPEATPDEVATYARAMAAILRGSSR